MAAMTAPDIIMFNAVDVPQIPAGPAAVAGYVDGRWPTITELAERFPNAHQLSIAVTAAHDAECLDIETGDATVADAAGWWDRQRKRGIERPCLYASASVMDAGIIPLVRSGRIPRAQVRLWSAHYAGLHICSAHTCGLTSIAMDGTQWTDKAWGRDLDESLLLPDFFGAPPTPRPVPAPAPKPAPVEDEMPAGVITVAAGTRESHTWLEGTVSQIVLYSDWEGIQDAAPVVDVRINHIASGPYDVGHVTVDRTMVYKIATPADCNGCALTRIDDGHATVAWHTNAP